MRERRPRDCRPGDPPGGLAQVDAAWPDRFRSRCLRLDGGFWAGPRPGGNFRVSARPPVTREATPRGLTSTGPPQSSDSSRYHAVRQPGRCRHPAQPPGRTSHRRLSPCFPSEARAEASPPSGERRKLFALDGLRSIPTRSVVRWRPCRPGRPGCSSSRSPRAPVPRWPGTRPVGRPTGRDRYRGRPGPGRRPGPCLFPARRRRRGGRRPGAYATGGWRCCRAVSHSRGLTSRANPCGDVREAPARRRQR